MVVDISKLSSTDGPPNLLYGNPSNTRTQLLWLLETVFFKLSLPKEILTNNTTFICRSFRNFLKDWGVWLCLEMELWNRSSDNDSLQKHQSESMFTRWRHGILRHCCRSTTRRHASPIPLYHLSRLRA